MSAICWRPIYAKSQNAISEGRFSIGNHRVVLKVELGLFGKHLSLITTHRWKVSLAYRGSTLAKPLQHCIDVEGRSHLSTVHPTRWCVHQRRRSAIRRRRDGIVYQK